MPDLNAARTAERVAVDFETYVSQTTETLQDLGALYAGIEYLRFLDGEKHLVLFTESGLRLWRREDNINIANAASDARIALDTIHTGGIAGPPPPRFDMNGKLIDAAAAEHRGGVQRGLRGPGPARHLRTDRRRGDGLPQRQVTPSIASTAARASSICSATTPPTRTGMASSASSPSR